ncbi:CD1247 N-terminal domain-containing protein [Limnochorda pilosa]|uniref:Zinc finger/thioredoxin putative domain-containing protein n=1 Tax=Limnochorda pilosa TaxID=1555112 RepID=A0A0K2SMT2_LIMPI|nr:CD1247 N-terminal domain-containing protein [Limnochorda pilosa]BAS28438.1 hypothetical protein LIP_2608 [Limnochorda pilosa]
MSDVKQKLAYARGLLEGRGTDGASGSEPVWTSVLEALDSLDAAVEAMRGDLEELEEYVQAVDDDLFDVEADLYGYDEADMTELECPSCHTPLVVEAEFLEDEASEVTCPECGHVIHRGPLYQGTSQEVAGAPTADGASR